MLSLQDAILKCVRDRMEVSFTSMEFYEGMHVQLEAYDKRGGVARVRGVIFREHLDDNLAGKMIDDMRAELKREIA
jgi:hypothetical protein